MISPIQMRSKNLFVFNFSLIQRFVSTKQQTSQCQNASIAVNRPNNQPNKNEKLIKVAIIGVPNAGKSTFINNLINHRVCPTSRKVHTTRTFSRAICVKNQSQLILFDTPGLVTEKEMRKHHLESSFNSAFRHSIQHSNLIGVVHDVSNSWTRNELHPTVLNTLKAYPKLPSILILNKVDTLKSKRMLLDVAKHLTQNTLNGVVGPTPLKEPLKPGVRQTKQLDEKNDRNIVGGSWPGFSEVFMISSITGDGLPAVMKYLMSKAKPSEWEFGADEFTDQPPEELVVQSVQAQLLNFLPQEIPYQLKCEIEFFSHEKGNIYASVLVACPTARIERLVCGEKDGRLHQITERVTSDLIETFGIPISLTIVTQSPKKP